MELHIEVKRVRISVTQGFAEVYVNGEQALSFGDEIHLLKEGDTYYGEKIDGWASVTPDEAFIKGLLYHEHDDIYHYSDTVRKLLDSPIEAAKKQEKEIIERERKRRLG